MHSELTLLTTFAMHHLVIGGFLLLILSAVTKLFKPSAELRSWLWLTAFVVSTVVPFSSYVNDSELQASIVNNSANNGILAFDSNDEKEASERLSKENSSEVQFANASRSGKLLTNQDKTYVRPQWHVSGQFVHNAIVGLYILCILWAVGSVWRTFSIGRTIWSTRQLVVSTRPLEKKIRFENLDNIKVVTSRLTDSPMVIGVLSPVILLPESLYNELNDNQLTAVILHELAHIQRRDLWVGAFQETIAIIFWWSPVIRIINRKIHINRELACDMRAAKKLASGKQYAQSLVDCTKLMLSQHRNLLAMGLFSKKKDLTYRVNEVLKINHVQIPGLVTTALICSLFAYSTISIAHNYAPQINLSAIEKQSNRYANLSREQGELLMEVIEDNDLEMLTLMIDNGLDINTMVVGDGTPLIAAVQHGHRELVEKLLELGAEVNKPAEGDGNPIIMAAKANNLEIAKYLLDQGADVNAAVTGDETPLINASAEGYLEMVKFLVASGADVNLGVEVSLRNGKTEYWNPLNRAQNQEIKDFLVSNGAR